MTILPQGKRGLPYDYADDDMTSICSLYSDIQKSYNTPHSQLDQQRQQQQYLQHLELQHLEPTFDQLQPNVSSSLDHLPIMLMSQSQNSQFLEVGDNGNNDSDDNNNNNSSKELTITTDTGNNYGDIPYYSGDNSFLPTTLIETSGQVSLYGNPISNSSEFNNSERGVAGFVAKLYQSLHVSQNNYTFVRWCRHDGKDMFLIDCIPRFTAEVLPRLFKHCKFQSFVRQLNIYGFQRDTDARKSKDTKDKEVCRWYHFFFRPGRRDLIHLIRRKTTMNTRRKRIQATDQHPEPMMNLTLTGNYSDGDGEKLIQQRHSSASDSFSNLNFEQPSSSTSSSSMVQHPSPQDTYCKTIPAPCFTYIDPMIRQTASPSSTTSSLSLSSLYMQETLQTSMEQSMETVHSTSMDPPHDNIYRPSVYQNTGNAIQLPPSSSSPPFGLNTENELQQHLLQLQISYSNDRDFYTKQIQLAHAHIKKQQVHIDQLEAISSHQQLQNHHPQIKQEQQQQQHQATPNSTMTPIINNNNNMHSSNNITKKEPVYETWDGEKDIYGKTDPHWPVLSPPDDVPNRQCPSQDDFGFYSIIPIATESPPSHHTHDNVLLSLLSSSNHTKMLQP